MAAICAESETNASFEICDLSQINNVAYLISRGALKTPIYMDFSMGTLGKAPASIDNLAFYVRTAKELIGDIRFTTCCHGSYTMTLQAASMAMGGDVRVGMQDSLHRGNGQVVKRVMQSFLCKFVIN